MGNTKCVVKMAEKHSVSFYSTVFLGANSC